MERGVDEASHNYGALHYKSKKPAWKTKKHKKRHESVLLRNSRGEDGPSVKATPVNANATRLNEHVPACFFHEKR